MLIGFYIKVSGLTHNMLFFVAVDENSYFHLNLIFHDWHFCRHGQGCGRGAYCFIVRVNQGKQSSKQDYVIRIHWDSIPTTTNHSTEPQ